MRLLQTADANEVNALPVIVFLVTVFTSYSARSHHTFATEYDRELTVTVEAVVTGVYFKNPHVRVDLLVATDRGGPQVWVANSVSPGALSHRGWLEDTITVGDRLTLYGNLGSNGSKRLWIQTITLADGMEIYPVGRVPERDEDEALN